MAAKRLVRAGGDVGAPLRHLDVHILREALSRMLRHEWEDAYLIYQLMVEGADGHGHAAAGADGPAARCCRSHASAAGGSPHDEILHAEELVRIHPDLCDREARCRRQPRERGGRVLV